MHPALEGRVLIPKDVFVTVCVEVKKLSDMMLQAALHLQKEINMLPEDSNVLNNLMQANVQLGLIERVLRAIIEEDLPKAEPGTNGGTPPVPGGLNA